MKNATWHRSSISEKICNGSGIQGEYKTSIGDPSEIENLNSPARGRIKTAETPETNNHTIGYGSVSKRSPKYKQKNEYFRLHHPRRVKHVH